MKKKTDTEIGAVWQKICQKMNYLRKKCLQEGNGYAIMYTRNCHNAEENNSET